MVTVNEKHWGQFLEFVYFERRAGGPDPHMKLAGRHVQGDNERDIWWMAGCYGAVYNYPTAEALYNTLTPDGAVMLGEDGLTEWLTEHWKGIATRRERRSVRQPWQLARCLISWAEFMADAEEAVPTWSGSPEENYQRLWEWLDLSVYAMGRYASLKVLEFLRRYAAAPIAMPDLRLEGGWSPVEGLELIEPAVANYGGQVAPVEALAEELRVRAADVLHLDAFSRFEMQVFLCDYKQAWHGRQYPGRSQDSEMEYAEQIHGHWEVPTNMWGYRAELFPHWALGEKNGWTGVRKELGKILPTYGYTWSDGTYDYAASVDLSTPALRPPPLVKA